VAEARALAPAPAPAPAPAFVDEPVTVRPERGREAAESKDVVRPRGAESTRPSTRSVGPRSGRTVPDGGMRPALVSGAGISPSVGYGLEIAAWFVWGSGAVEISGTRWLERLAALPPSERFGAAVGLDALAARACWNPE